MATESATGSDEQLVAAVRRGDDRAFEELYARYQRRIAAYAYGMVNDHGRAEDVTQEVFMSALRRMRQTERPIAFRPWVYEIAKNACIDQFRRSRRTEEVSFDADEGAGARLAHVAPGPDAAVDAKQQLDDLCGAFGGLSDTHHQILVLRELEGRSYREIGSRLDISRASVESTLFRARRRLTEEYDEIVSGARCRRVRSMLVEGAHALGHREERRLARHVAHCQPCRRQARLAGVDIAPPASRRVARRVAAWLPIPGLLHLRRVGTPFGDAHGVSLAQWSGSVSTIAEPAVNWGKAMAATAAVLAAGGAGAVTHERPAPPARVAPHVAPLRRAVEPAAAQHVAPAQPAKPRRPAPRDVRARAAKKRAGARRAHRAAPVRPTAPSAGSAAPAAGPPAAAPPQPAPPTVPVPAPAPLPQLRDDRSGSGTTTPETPLPAVPDVVQPVRDLASTADESVGKVVGGVQDLTGSNHV